MATIDQLIKRAHETAKSKGFHDDPQPFAVYLALIHSEVSEALEADRKNERFNPNTCDLEILAERSDADFKEKFEKKVKNTVEDELADIVIRVFDLAGLMGVDLESHIKAKLRYNATRGHKHGKAY